MSQLFLNMGFVTADGKENE